jgi:hypothetical protein
MALAPLVHLLPASSQNAISHGQFARHIVMRDRSPEGFEAVMYDHLTRLQPADGVELGMVEEMVASHRRAWAIETYLLENGTDAQTLTNAFADLAAAPSLGLLHRHQTRLHLNYQRALHSILLLSVATVPNEPSPISEHPAATVICLPNQAEFDPDPEVP